MFVGGLAAVDRTYADIVSQLHARTALKRCASLRREGIEMTNQSWARLSAAMGIPFVIGFIVLGALSGNSPDYKSSDGDITAWYANHTHRAKDIAGIFILAVSATFFLWFLGGLRETLRSAEGAGGRVANTAAASGTALITLLALAGSVFSAVAFVVSEAGGTFRLDPDTFRLLSGFGYLTYVVAFVLGAPLAFGVGAIAWRTRALPRWLAAASVLAGIAALASFAFITTLVYVAWILLLSGYLTFRPPKVNESLEAAT
jgi:hypothetical protein